MFVLKILTHPINEVILEYTLDKLVEEVWSYQLVNICARKMFGERLTGCVRWIAVRQQGGAGLTATSLMIPYFSQRTFKSNAALHAFVCSGNRNSGSIWSRLPGDEAQLDTIT